MNHLILFGPPGCGKGTQAPLIAQAYHLIHISTGDIFRKEMSINSQLGIEVSSYMNRGDLVPDELTIAVLRAEINRHPHVAGFIYDGFPRTLHQAHVLDAMLLNMGDEVSHVIQLNVADDILVDRITNRARLTDRKSELDPSIINRRLHLYREQSLPVSDHYNQMGKLSIINGENSINSIFQEISKILNSKLPHNQQ